jgi:hypothetical protein
MNMTLILPDFVTLADTGTKNVSGMGYGGLIVLRLKMTGAEYLTGMS